MSSRQGRPLIVRGARENNLRGLDVEIPRDRFVVVTGISGSGKSTLAHGIICREGQRRFVESLSAYARQYLGRLDRPKVETVEGLSPTISIDQKPFPEIQDQRWERSLKFSTCCVSSIRASVFHIVLPVAK